MTEWVTDRFGVRVHTAPDAGIHLSDLVGLALRRNPKRAHLLVSRVLGKHVPADPRAVHHAGLHLGERVREQLGTAGAVVLGFAETATGLGHCVAEALGADYLHSTRRHVPSARAYAGFEEEHSHATSHRLLPSDPGPLSSSGVLVLVDDEVSTGRTALNTIAALHAVAPRGRYVIAALVDLRCAADREAMAEFAAGLGVGVEVVALSFGEVDWPPEFPALAAATVAEIPEPGAAGPPAADVRLLPDAWPSTAREGGRHGSPPRTWPPRSAQLLRWRPPWVRTSWGRTFSCSAPRSSCTHRS